MKITVHGAAGEVTVSAYLIETDRARILIDLGMFQGSSEQDPKNVLPSGLLSKPLDAVLLTHAHLDHVGRLPLLAKAGYTGEIYATGATRELAGLFLRATNGEGGDEHTGLALDRFLNDRAEFNERILQGFVVAVAVSGFHENKIGALEGNGITKDSQAGRPDIAGEDNDPGFVIFLNGKFDARSE